MGDEVELTVNESNREIIIRKAPSIPPGLDPQFFDVLSANIERYRETIEGLKDR
ncbi:MAG: hypothetical protein K6T64_16265 [Kyrpidia sp.]|nr:hypothetical protein [Kyrpidia sp.]